MESPSNYNKYKYIITPDCYKCNKINCLILLILLFYIWYDKCKPI